MTLSSRAGLLFSVPSVAEIELLPAPLSPSLCLGARPALLHPPSWCVGWQALLWSLVDAWVSGGPGVQNGSCVCSLPAAVRIYYTCYKTIQNTEHYFFSLWSLYPLWLRLNIFQPPLLSPPPWCPPRSASARPCVAGAGRRFCGALWMHGYPTVQGCEVNVMWLAADGHIKYIIYVI